MKPISRLFQYDEAFMDGKIPEQAQYLPNPELESPLYIKRNMLSEQQCDAMVHALTSGFSGNSAENKAGNRLVTTYYLNGEVKKIYKKTYKVARQQIERYYKVKLSNEMRAHALGYTPGGKYTLHSDNCNPVLDADRQILKFEIAEPDRQFSTLLYLSDHVESVSRPNEFTGGTLTFNYLFDLNGDMLTIKPRKGMFVAFPSNPVFSHQAHPVTEGYRMAIVDWHSAKYL